MLYNYEQFSLSEWVDNERDKTMLTKDEENRVKKISSEHGKNPFYMLYSLLEIEGKDAESFLDVIMAMEMFTLKRD